LPGVFFFLKNIGFYDIDFIQKMWNFANPG